MLAFCIFAVLDNYSFKNRPSFDHFKVSYLEKNSQSFFLNFAYLLRIAFQTCFWHIKEDRYLTITTKLTLSWVEYVFSLTWSIY